MTERYSALAPCPTCGEPMYSRRATHIAIGKTDEGYVFECRRGHIRFVPDEPASTTNGGEQ